MNDLPWHILTLLASPFLLAGLIYFCLILIFRVNDWLDNRKYKQLEIDELLETCRGNEVVPLELDKKFCALEKENKTLKLENKTLKLEIGVLQSMLAKEGPEKTLQDYKKEVEELEHTVDNLYKIISRCVAPLEVLYVTDTEKPYAEISPVLRRGIKEAVMYMREKLLTRKT